MPDKEMSNLRQRGTLLEENIKLKKEQKAMNERIDDLTGVIEDKMGRMLDALNEIKDKDPVVVIKEGEGTVVEKKDGVEKKHEYKPAPFIPTVDTTGMKVSATVEKKKRKTDLTGAADKLSKMKNEGVK